jgi:hypothetical protein
MTITANKVPRSTDNPIRFLVDKCDLRIIDLANEWGLNTLDQVYRLMRFDSMPSFKTARLMSKSFGWKSAGEVIDFWMAKRDAAATTEDTSKAATS